MNSSLFYDLFELFFYHFQLVFYKMGENKSADEIELLFHE